MSNNYSQLLTKELSFNDQQIIEDISLHKIQYMKKSNKVKFILKCCRDITPAEKSKLNDAFNKKIGDYCSFDLCFYKEVVDASVEEITTTYWMDVISMVSAEIPVAKDFLLSSKLEIKENEIKICNNNEFVIKILRGKDLERALSSVIRDIFGRKCNVILHHDGTIVTQDYFNKKEQENITIIKNTVVTTEVKEVNNTKTNVQSSAMSEDVIMGKDIRDEIISINSIDEASGVVTIQGEIFKTKIIDTRSGKKIITFNITDLKGSITVKCFPKPKDMDRVLEEINEGLFCKVRGEAVNDAYAREVVIMARDIVKASKSEKLDDAKEKRVELHLHTQMSSMDGVSSTSKLIARAAKWGHNAIAITDHGVVQAFPEAMDAAKKYKIKVLYGVEAYFVDDGVPIVQGCKAQDIRGSFVVLDIETTGFSPTEDKIIEIGAVKICNGKIVDTFSTFVNPNRNIPYKIQELTGINPSMVENAPKIEEIIEEFIGFAGDSVLVAHNASFDISFIRKVCTDMNIQLDNAIMDTIPLAKFLFPELKRYKLDIVAKHLGINLENHHRAIDDAKATAQILLKCFDILEQREIIRLKQLNENYLNTIDVKKLNTYHMIILVKNQVGLKNLYKLISYSNLDYFFKRPRIPKSLLMSHKEGLIIGSACEAGQIYKEILSGKSIEELKEVVELYDYLEIQPIGNNKFMTRNGTVKDDEQLKDINKKIYELGKHYKKPTVATCDVHFLDPEDEVFRRILMAGQGFNDADEQAPLYLRNTKEMLQEFDYLGKEVAEEVVIKNTNLIADMIDEIKPIPDETFPPKIDGAEEDIKNMTLAKAHAIYGDVLPEVVQKRLDKELNSIINNGYAVLYLIAQKLVAKSLEDGYLVGSRGSVGSSFVATMSNITEVNGLPPHYVCPECKNSEFITDGSISSGADLPDKNCPNCGSVYIKDGHDIPFETFLGFEGDKEPDIDLNFSGEYQAVVHKYTEVLFGKGFVFKAGTIGTVAEKTAYGFVKKYLDEKNVVVPQAEIDRLTIGCTGIKRTTGQHPGGIMVVPRDNEIFNFTPIQHPADDSNSDIITTHFDYHSISGRLLKLDILGHDDPTVLRMLQDLTGLDPKKIPLADPKVMSLFTSPEALGITREELHCDVGTYGLPEFGTKFVRQMLIDTKPESFADLVRISGLSHGTDVWLNNAQYYIKEGMTTLKDCISTRDDIMVYLMYQGVPPKTAFTIMERVRKGKGLRDEDILVMKENKVPDWYIESCNKIKYMFPKGHAVAYVMMAVRIAYYKVYYPLAYYATYFTVRADDFDAELISMGEEAVYNKMEELNNIGNNMTQKDKGLLTILEIAFEMYKRGYNLLKVDLYKSQAQKFTIEGNSLRPPIQALQGVGENAAKSIVEARKEGEFISKEDLRIRAKVSKTVIEIMQQHGCLEGLPESNQLSLF